MTTEQQEISGETINKYVACINNLSICTGKLDMLLSYAEQNYNQDKFLLSSLESLLKDILNAIKQPLIKKIEFKNKSYYTFQNSSNLAEIISTNSFKTRIKFQTGRLYDYFNVPQNKIKTFIICDKDMISPGKYFNSEIRGQYEYREVTKDLEMVG